MPVMELYSKRKKKAEISDEPFIYDVIPLKFKNQFYHICKDAFSIDGYINNFPEQTFAWKFIEKTLLKEYGLMSLGYEQNIFERLMSFFLTTDDSDQCLDIIELTFRFYEKVLCKKWPFNSSDKDPKKFIDELNIRFLENNLGFEYVNGKIIRQDSKYIHKEIVKNAISLLNDNNFEGATDEFMNAHKHYREGNYKEALNDSLKAFESTMKTICQKKNWEYKQTFNAKKLIEVMFNNEIIPKSMQSHFYGLKTTLESGIPTIRNKNSGHGQGEAKVKVSRSLAHYGLNLTAVNIVFLVESLKDLSR